MKEKLLLIHNFWKCQFQVQILIQEFWQLFPQTAANSIMAACCKGKPKKEPVWQAKLTAVRGLTGSSRLPVSAFHWNAWFYMTVSLYMKPFATLKYCLYMTVILHRHNYMCIDFRWSHPLVTSVFVHDLYMIVCGLSLSKNSVIYFNFLVFFSFQFKILWIIRVAHIFTFQKIWMWNWIQMNHQRDVTYQKSTFTHGQ